MTTTPTTGTVGHAMTRPVVGIVAHAGLDTALRVMCTQGVRHLLVVDLGRRTGLIHETDLLWALCTRPPGHRGTVASCARDDVLVAAPTDRLAEVAARMTAARTDVVLVADQHDVVGIVTVTDVLRHLAGGVELLHSGLNSGLDGTGGDDTSR